MRLPLRREPAGPRVPTAHGMGPGDPWSTTPASRAILRFCANDRGRENDDLDGGRTHGRRRGHADRIPGPGAAPDRLPAVSRRGRASLVVLRADRPRRPAARRDGADPAAQRPPAGRDRPVDARLRDGRPDRRARQHSRPARRLVGRLRPRARPRPAASTTSRSSASRAARRPGAGVSAATTSRFTTRSSAARSSPRPRTSSAPTRPTARCSAPISTARWPPPRISAASCSARSASRSAREARVAPVAPSDLVGCNRPKLTVGDRPLPLTEIWRRPLGGPARRALWPACRRSSRRRSA